MGAPKGNLFALGNTGGQEPKYDDPQEMMKKIAEYLDYEDSLKRPDTYSKAGKGVYTIEGCALWLGFASRQSMYDYEKKSKEFSYIVNRFKLFLTHWNAQKLYWAGTMPGAKFWLTNWGGYTEETTQNQNVVTTELKIETVKGTPKLEDSE
jgi:hypothetical protein